MLERAWFGSATVLQVLQVCPVRVRLTNVENHDTVLDAYIARVPLEHGMVRMGPFLDWLAGSHLGPTDSEASAVLCNSNEICATSLLMSSHCNSSCISAFAAGIRFRASWWCRHWHTAA